ncbi:MAG: PAC2 family protein [Candidatus Geothermarchaeales archaeon]
MKYHGRPEFHRPVLVAGWPGMGLLAKIATDYLKDRLHAELFAEIRSYRNDIAYKDGVASYVPLKHSFYAAPEHNLIICVGESQPSLPYEIYNVAHKVVDLAKEFDVRRIYTVAAYFSPDTPSADVFVVVNDPDLSSFVEKHGVEIAPGEGRITGLNGVLIGVAEERDIEGVCLMGRIQYAELPQPGPAKILIDVLAGMLDMSIDTSELSERQVSIDESIKKRISEVKRQAEKRDPGDLRYIG